MIKPRNDPTPPGAEDDPFGPPKVPIQVECLHCGEQYDSSLIHWVEEVVDGKKTGFWCCPTPGCGGRGFGFDIFPADPDWQDPEGKLFRVDDDEPEDEEGLPDDDSADNEHGGEDDKGQPPGKEDIPF